MAEGPWDIDAIVGEVVRRLEQQLGTTSPARQQPQASSKNDQKALTIPDRVVTLASVDRWLDGVRRVVLRPDALITPAVKDELARREITVTRSGGSAKAAGGSEKDEATLVVGVAETDYNPAAVLRAIGSAATLLESPVGGALQDVVFALIRCLEQRQLGLLITEGAAAAACLANRRSGIRAVLGVSPAAAARDCDLVGANLLIVNPHNCTLYETINMTRRFVRQGPRECPPPLRNILDGKPKP